MGVDINFTERRYMNRQDKNNINCVFKYIIEKYMSNTN